MVAATLVVTPAMLLVPAAAAAVMEPSIPMTATNMLAVMMAAVALTMGPITRAIPIPPSGDS
ncbi:hypothetical protein PtrM4_131490 [Pyrenophora tritici-repentis]|uniref:Uncharacterized protein n=1 Tax=Pyrenophora tritici-repentis TaxID=45151 RepID=A0A834VL94_9PLEO|nr:hypothetical protein PtrM4_131490 [Pyrenophora tritici-repentis]